MDFFGIDALTVTILSAIIIITILLAWLRIRKYRERKDGIVDESPDEVFKMASRVKYPAATRNTPERTGQETVLKKPGIAEPANTELVNGRKDLTDSLHALVQKYRLDEITLATDDGLVFATTTDRDMQPEAVKYSQLIRHMGIPNEPDVTLFELIHKESRLIGILKSPHDLSHGWKREIREDTKVILQWWL
jgi:hypothetical protein